MCDSRGNMFFSYFRMTSTEALEHPFIKGPTARMSSAVMSRPPSRRHIVLPDPLLDIACEIAERFARD